MRLTALSLRDFRNIAEARLVFEGRRHFFLGPNGQGKTNLLEAAGCLTALRSFRAAETPVMIRAGAAEAGIAAELEHEHRGPTALRIALRPDGKELWSDGEKVSRLSDHLGQFPVVAFSSQDLQLLRGSPALRRRWLDLTLAAMDAAYLRALQTYARALAGRNRLLKDSSPNLAELTAFEHVLAPAAAGLVRLRRSGLAELGSTVAAAYRSVSGAAETASLGYEPALGGKHSGGGNGELAGKEQAFPETGGPARTWAAPDSPSAAQAAQPPAHAGSPSSSQLLKPGPENASWPTKAAEEPAYWVQAFGAARKVDFRIKSTSIGPHRDDLDLLIGGAAARDYASEGQQRSFVLALRLAQAAWFQARSRARPVILADDVLGELDPDRRRRFWSAIDPDCQVLATGTSEPEASLGAWQTFRVSEGRILGQ
ncbi:MAG TPA: DNA replication and repair protein RecF [Opitutaceae bacterium]|jgi:DNA replication and repair protein RecF|nr:DNA replication and repair protein RecF [Opitutaceae bacterium]